MSVAAGFGHWLVCTTNGKVAAWGANDHGQVGDGTTRARSSPVTVIGPTDVVAVAAGQWASFACTSDGALWAWGSGFGPTPVELDGLDSRCRAISAAGQRAIALLEDGSLVQWDGGPPSFLPVPGPPNVAAIATGERHGLAVHNDGTVWTWGDNQYGQLGDGTVGARADSRPVPGLNDVKAVAAGWGQSYALGADGTVWAWGANADGRTTFLQPDAIAEPFRIAGTTVAVGIAAGSNRCWAFRADGSVLAWGGNLDGALGDGTTESRSTPVTLTTFDEPLVAVATSAFASVGVDMQGRVLAWGGEYPVSDSDADPEIRVGASKLGGQPDLPPGFLWPTFGDVPQAFVAQIDLGELSGHDRWRLLPTSGLLTFFYEAESVSGYGQEEAGGWLVQHFPAGVALERRDFPSNIPDYKRFPGVALSALADVSLPSNEALGLALTHEEWSRYIDLREERRPVHRMLGHPEPVQGDPRWEILAGAPLDWVLLLQLDSDDAARTMWGDVGMLYYWIRVHDLAAGRFEMAWMTMQCA